MDATKRSISPRITEEILRPRLEDTEEVPQVKTVVQTKEEEPYVKSDHMDKFFMWKKKYGVSSFAVPPTMGKSNKEPEYVGINGMGFYIERGVSVELPLNIAKVLSEKYDIQLNLGKNIDGKNMRVNEDFAKMSALSL